MDFFISLRFLYNIFKYFFAKKVAFFKIFV